MPHHDLEQRISSVEHRQRDLESELRRLKTEILDNVDERYAAAVRLVEKMITQEIGSIRNDLEEIKLDQKTQLQQLGTLTEAAEERGRRKQRLEEQEMRAREASISGEEKETDVKAELGKANASLVAANASLVAAKASATRWKGIAVAIALVLGALVTLFGAYSRH